LFIAQLYILARMPFGMEGNLSPLSASLSQRKDPLAMPEKCYVSSLRPTERYAPNNFADVGKEPHRRLLLVICALSLLFASPQIGLCAIHPICWMVNRLLF
jgi:hypothetical protein